LVTPRMGSSTIGTGQCGTTMPPPVIFLKGRGHTRGRAATSSRPAGPGTGGPAALAGALGHAPDALRTRNRASLPGTPHSSPTPWSPRSSSRCRLLFVFLGFVLLVDLRRPRRLDRLQAGLLG